MKPSAGVRRIAPPAALILSIISSKKCACFVTVSFSVVISTEVSKSITAYLILASSKSSLSPFKAVIVPDSAVRVFVVTLSASTSPINFTPLTFSTAVISPPAVIFPSAVILPPSVPSSVHSDFTVISPPEADIF